MIMSKTSSVKQINEQVVAKTIHMHFYLWVAAQKTMCSMPSPHNFQSSHRINPRLSQSFIKTCQHLAAMAVHIQLVGHRHSRCGQLQIALALASPFSQTQNPSIVIFRLSTARSKPSIRSARRSATFLQLEDW